MSKTKKQRKNHKLGSIAISAIVVFSVLIMLATSVLVILQYKNNIVKQYSEQAVSYAKTASAYIDGDKVAQYIQTKQSDDYYNEIDRYLNIMRENSKIKYFYVFVPYEDQIMYVWDADTRENESLLGEYEPYITDEDMKASLKAFNTDKVAQTVISYSIDYGNIATAYYPIYNSDGTPVAVIGVDFEMISINSSIKGFVVTFLLALLIVIAVFTVIFYGFVNHAILKPIKTLSNAAQGIVENIDKNENFKIDIHTHDEIEELAHSFEDMYKEICTYISEISQVTAEKERIGAELNVATNIQSNMLPSIFPPFPERKEFDIYATMNPAKEVGGDFYDFFLVDDDHLALVIADVSGKGVPAALFMVIAKTMLKNQAQAGSSPKEILDIVNNQLCENNKDDMFVTVWLGIYEISTHTMRAANAGHEFPAIRRKNGEFELYKDPHGLVLACVEDFSYEEYSFKLNEGDTLFVYTDGVAEATNSSEELYGTERMLKALNKQNMSQIVVSDILESVHQDIDDFVQEAPQFDDITMMAITIRS